MYSLNSEVGLIRSLWVWSKKHLKLKVVVSSYKQRREKAKTDLRKKKNMKKGGTKTKQFQYVNNHWRTTHGIFTPNLKSNYTRFISLCAHCYRHNHTLLLAEADTGRNGLTWAQTSIFHRWTQVTRFHRHASEWLRDNAISLFVWVCGISRNSHITQHNGQRKNVTSVEMVSKAYQLSAWSHWGRAPR